MLFRSGHVVLGMMILAAAVVLALVSGREARPVSPVGPAAGRDGEALGRGVFA